MKLFLLSTMLLSAFFLHAQQDVPSFGELTRRELTLTECDFDKDADAIILFHVARSSYNEEHNLITL